MRALFKLPFLKPKPCDFRKQRGSIRSCYLHLLPVIYEKTENLNKEKNQTQLNAVENVCIINIYRYRKYEFKFAEDNNAFKKH